MACETLSHVVKSMLEDCETGGSAAMMTMSSTAAARSCLSSAKSLGRVAGARKLPARAITTKDPVTLPGRRAYARAGDRR